MRYYRYGCHPYQWYGYYPVAREIGGDTYNYYTYNYYNDGAETSSYDYTSGDISTVDQSTFADVRAKLARQAAEEPDAETEADRYFEEAVKAFEDGYYEKAADKFLRAMQLAPDDMVLPFAYVQAIFATGRFSEAAEVLRDALAKVSPEKEGIYYPRGLYADDEVLFGQIELLNEKAQLYSFDGDLQLLLGYQLLGVGELDKADDPLRAAMKDLDNVTTAITLLDVLEELKSNASENVDL